MAVTYCNTAAILDSALLETVDNSATMRTKALAWLNQAIRDVLNQPRVWKFLDTSATLNITSNQATLPTGATDISYILLGDTYLDKDDQISDEAALTGISEGYTLSSTGIITFYPDTTEITCTVKYEAGLDTKYTDAATATIFPIQFENLLLSGTLLRCFKTDKDGRFNAESSLFEYQLKLMKEWDNRLKPMPHIDSNAYSRISRMQSGIAE